MEDDLMNITYKTLTTDQASKISDIDASQFIKRAWRHIDHKLQLIDLNYQSDGFPEGFDNHYKGLIETIESGGYAIGAFDSDKLIGFATVNNDKFGNKYTYVLLDQMFISVPYRQKGIGKKLFSYCVTKAKSWQVDKLYICAGSAEDTTSFYRSLGCRDAMEVNLELYESDPRDIQLEYDL